MEKYIDVMKQSTELLKTALEGLQHIQTLLSEGKFEDSIFLFENTVQAFSTIENSLKGFPDDILTEDIQTITNNVRNAFEIVVSSYETKNYAKVQEVLQFTLIPRYKNWEHELEKTFNPYLVS
jgi:RNA binding exosome subunit